MKNIHLLPTDKPSRLQRCASSEWFDISKESLIDDRWKYQNIYITSSDEEIKEGDWFYLDDAIIVAKYIDVKPDKEAQKIILTTNQDLIKDGVQSIDDEFLEWFVKNPSCEVVEVINEQYTQNYHKDIWYNRHKIIIPKEESKDVVLGYKTSLDAQMLDKVGLEEPKQETLEEAAERLAKDAYKKHSVKDDKLSLDEQIQRSGGFIVGFKEGMIEGAKWQAERMYSKEEVVKIVEKSRETGLTAEFLLLTEQFKKKS